MPKPRNSGETGKVGLPSIPTSNQPVPLRPLPPEEILKPLLLFAQLLFEAPLIKISFLENGLKDRHFIHF